MFISFFKISFQNICILTSVEDIWLRTADEFKTAMEKVGIDRIILQYIFPQELEAAAEDAILEILQGLTSKSRSGCFVNQLINL